MSDEIPDFDPYEPRPTFLECFGDKVAAAAVFVCTVVLTIVSFPPFETPEFAYAMLVPAIFWAYTKPAFKLYLWTMFAAQAVAWTIILGWLHHVTWLGLFLLGPFIGAWVGTWYLVAWWTLPRMLDRHTLVRLIAMLGLASVWVLIEWTRTWVLSGFPWLPLAASQWERSSILQVAAFTGSSGISFVLVAINIGFATMAHSLFVRREGGLNFRRPEFLLSLFLLMGCVSVHIQETFNRRGFNVPMARVAFVQPAIPQSVKWDADKGPEILGILEKTTLAAAATWPDLILWPEASTPWAVVGEPTARDFVETLAKRAHGSLLLGTIAIERSAEGEKWFNAAVVSDPVAGVQNTFYAKRHLVPFGEYVPLRPVLGWLKKFVEVGDDDFQRGLDSSPLVISVRGTSLTAGPLICYEDVFPDLALRSVRAGSDFLAVLTNDAWYGESGAAQQHAAHSVLRAVETRRPVLRCGNAGWSGWIDEFGNIRAVAQDEEGSVYFRGTKTFNVSRDARWVGRNTFYVEHGDWFVIACAVTWLLTMAVLLVGVPPAPKAEPDAA